MMNAFSSGVSGLKSQQTSLDVIANNISNVNTTGYKSQRVSFSDLLSQTISAGTSSTTNSGGTNSVQLGLGVSVGSIDNIMTAGTAESTGVNTDVSIGGEGFFVVQGGTKGTYQYTRAGNLSTDDTGNLTVNGYKVCGWEQYTIDDDGNYVYNTSSAAEPINIYTDAYNGNKKVIPAQATTTADFTGTLDPTKTVATTATALNDIGTTPTSFDQTSTITAYDSQGNSYDVDIDWKKCKVDSTSNTTSWYWQASTSDAGITPSSGYVLFNSDGKMVDVAIDSTTANTTGYSDTNVSVGSDLSSIISGTGTTSSPVTSGTYTVTSVANASGGYDLTLTGTGISSPGITVNSTDGSATFTDTNGKSLLTLSALASSNALAAGSMSFTAYTDTTSVATISVKPTSGSTAAFNVDLNFGNVNTYTSSSSSVTGTADGYKSGELESISISDDGTIVGTYSNDQTQSLAKIALAVFNNPAGLEKIGSNLYATSANSGSATIVSAGSGGSGSLSSGSLEMSNVDLAEAFSDMMVTQRAYQANSKVISTADEMMQSLISMKG
ncbi:flagellar hook protein FlgE [Pelosinus sp. sgz500959]|uniref:flagellar hook protein FlgE n=1 Tax=Pelosinus sp. sgz500959 TaxID=3242472 RepID=UPI0036714016